MALVNTHTAGSQSGALVHTLPAGGWVTMWTSEGQDGSGSGVFQQVFSALGEKVGLETRVNQVTAGNQVLFGHVATPEGGWQTLWLNDIDLDGVYGLCFQSFNASGEPIGDAKTIDASLPSSAELTPLANGGWIISWQQWGPHGYALNSVAYAPDGTVLVGEDILAQDASAFEITGLKNGGWITTWSAPGTSGTDIFYQVFKGDGTAQSAPARVNTTVQNDQTRPEVTATSDGGWVVTWINVDRPTYNDGWGNSYQPVYSVRHQAYHANGTKNGGEVVLAATHDPLFSDGGRGFFETVDVIAGKKGSWITTWKISETLTYWAGQSTFDYNYSAIVVRLTSADGVDKGLQVVASGSTAPWSEGGYSSVESVDTIMLAGGGWVVGFIASDKDGGRYFHQCVYDIRGNFVEDQSVWGWMEFGSDIKMTASPNGGWTTTYNIRDFDTSPARPTDIYQQTFYPTLTNIYPDAVNDNLTIAETDITYLDVLANDTDDDGDALIVTQAQILSGDGRVTIDDTGRLFYHDDTRGLFDDETRTVQIRYTVEDGKGGYADAVVTLTIEGLTEPIEGDDNDNVLIGTSHGEHISGKGGNDKVYGNGGDDFIHGGAGADEIHGGDGNDILRGGDGKLRGGDGKDVLYGDAGDDDIDATEGDVAYGGAGNDLIRVYGTGARVFGNAGDDRLVSLGGTGVLDGGEGTDIYYANQRHPSLEGLNFANIEILEADPDVYGTISQFESFSTIRGWGRQPALHIVNAGVIDLADELDLNRAIVYASAFGNSIKTGKRDDTLVGGAGNDTLDGNGGSNILTGGLGKDTFVFRPDTNYAISIVTDFSAGDKIALDGLPAVRSLADIALLVTDDGKKDIEDAVLNFTKDGRSVSVKLQGVDWRTLTVNDFTRINTAPDFSAPRQIDFIENASVTSPLLSFAARDAQGDVITYSVGGDDALFFSVNSLGQLRFKASPDFEAKADKNHDGIFSIQLRASDGDLTTAQTLLVKILNANDAPVITSNGSGTTANITLAENTAKVTRMTAFDADSGSKLTFSIVGGADKAKFGIDKSTGALSFLSNPDFEKPGDADKNNIYSVTVRVSDGNLIDTQTLNVKIGNANEAPVITSNAGAATATISVQENKVGVTKITAADVDSGSKLTFSIIDGADKTKFAIDKTTGLLTFLSAPDFEKPGDADKNNIYTVKVQVSDGRLNDMQTLTVRVTDVIGFTKTGTSKSETLRGASEQDILNGKAGKDLLVGGAGSDSFVFDTKLGPAEVDTIDDFTVKSDKILLDDDIFTKVGKVGPLASSAFAIGAKAGDASDRIIYNKATGAIWYDPDGNGALAATQFAIVDKGLSISAADFLIIA
ncbi:cadherin domain-containing protein [Shinella curvata]|uniref:Cadherin domain-containing protein n=1 Tax=Shinella curvata TaxID=1817964 RepID=A0ABT8XM34_9HYPH|nr:cadherin domain-containing protein [Shinella curvata]MCJ8056687.1 cadherin domain-containing protein [Shinella curvata]MDO6124473.1 cadherin domain-containing protein [Shinella curvata]